MWLVVLGAQAGLMTTGSFAPALSQTVIRPTAEPCACTSAGETDGFHALAVLTDDADWEEKWATPSDTVVYFNPVSQLDLGEVGMLLVFFANPSVTDGQANIACDLTIRKPNGAVQNVPPFLCFDAEPLGPVSDIRMTSLHVELKVEASDPTGEWMFEIGVADTRRGVRVPLVVKVDVDAGPRANP
jgi:hypothetical protein